MARTPKPVSMQTSHLTKEEAEDRLEQEQKLKGNDDKVYIPPKGLKKAVKDIYISIVEELRQANILNNLDIPLLETTSNAIYRLRNAQKNLNKFGEVLTDENGKLYKSPWVQVEKDYQAIFHTGCLQLGLSPSSRAKLALMATQTKEEEEDDDF